MPLPPVVTDVDRAWALAQCPSWAVRGPLAGPPVPDPEGEISDDVPARKPVGKVLNWDRFVADQIERFERYFAHERKSAQDWSNLWRRSWWPKADPRILHPNLIPKTPNTHPVFRRGEASFDVVLSLGSASERMIWRKLGLAQLKPDDPRLAKLKRLEPRVVRNPAGDNS